MKNKKREIEGFYTQIFADTKLKEKILEESKKIKSEEGLKGLIKKHIMPLVEKHKKDFSENDLLDYEKETLSELPEEALSDVSGGRGIAIKPLLGLGIMTLSMFGGMGAQSFAAGGSGKGRAVQQQQVTSSDDENNEDEYENEENNDIDLNNIDTKKINIEIDDDGNISIEYEYDGQSISMSVDTLLEFAESFQENGGIYSPKNAKNISRALKCILFNEDVMEALGNNLKLLDQIHEVMAGLRDNENIWSNIPERIQNRINAFLDEYEQGNFDDEDDEMDVDEDDDDNEADVNEDDDDDEMDIEENDDIDLNNIYPEEINIETGNNGISIEYSGHTISIEKFLEIADNITSRDDGFFEIDDTSDYGEVIKAVMFNDIDGLIEDESIDDNIETLKKIKKSKNTWRKLPDKVQKRIKEVLDKYEQNKFDDDEDEIDVDAKSMIKNIKLNEGYFFAHDESGNYFVCQEGNDGVLISYFSPTKEKLENLEVPEEVETENGEEFPVVGLLNDKKLEKVSRRSGYTYEERSKSGAPVRNLIIPQSISAAPGTKTLIIEGGTNSNTAGTIDLRNITDKLVIEEGAFKEVENLYLPENCKEVIIEENAIKKVNHLFISANSSFYDQEGVDKALNEALADKSFNGVNSDKYAHILEDNETIAPSAFVSIGTVEFTGSTIKKDLSETERNWEEIAFNSPGRERSASGGLSDEDYKDSINDSDYEFGGTWEGEFFNYFKIPKFAQESKTLVLPEADIFVVNSENVDQLRNFGTIDFSNCKNVEIREALGNAFYKTPNIIIGEDCSSVTFYEDVLDGSSQDIQIPDSVGRVYVYKCGADVIYGDRTIESDEAFDSSDYVTKSDSNDNENENVISAEVNAENKTDEAPEISVSQVAIDTNLDESSDSITSAAPHEIKIEDNNSENPNEKYIRFELSSDETDDEGSSDSGITFDNSASYSSEESSDDITSKNIKGITTETEVKLPFRYYFMSYKGKVNYLTSKVQNAEDLNNLNQKSRDKLTKQLSRLGKKIRRTENGHLMAQSFLKTYHENDFNKDALKTLNQVSHAINS